jgi:hypothetical protein
VVEDPLNLGLTQRETPEERRLRKRVFMKDDIHWCARGPTQNPHPVCCSFCMHSSGCWQQTSHQPVRTRLVLALLSAASRPLATLQALAAVLCALPVPKSGSLCDRRAIALGGYIFCLVVGCIAIPHIYPAAKWCVQRRRHSQPCYSMERRCCVLWAILSLSRPPVMLSATKLTLLTVLNQIHCTLPNTGPAACKCPMRHSEA